jgi:diguanylate cyclase (GGDEF)-like protein
VFRWGGDEFLILLSCAEEEARRRGVALQMDFARYSAAATLPPGVGLSIGSAEITEDSDDVMGLIKVADDRMYQNKRAQHRNHAPARAARATKAR